MFIILAGNPFETPLTVFGPFKSRRDASAWANDKLTEEWFLSYVKNPEGYHPSDDRHPCE